MKADIRISRKPPIPKKYAKSICNDTRLLKPGDGTGPSRQVRARTAFQKGKGLIQSRAKIPAPSPMRDSPVHQQDSTGKQEWRSAPNANRLLEGGNGVSSEHPVSPPQQESSMPSEGDDRVQYSQLRLCTEVNKNMHLVQIGRGAAPTRPATKLTFRRGNSPCCANGPNYDKNTSCREATSCTTLGTHTVGVKGQPRPLITVMPSALPSRALASAEPIFFIPGPLVSQFPQVNCQL